MNLPRWLTRRKPPQEREPYRDLLREVKVYDLATDQHETHYEIIGVPRSVCCKQAAIDRHGRRVASPSEDVW